MLATYNHNCIQDVKETIVGLKKTDHYVNLYTCYILWVFRHLYVNMYEEQKLSYLAEINAKNANMYT